MHCCNRLLTGLTTAFILLSLTTTLPGQKKKSPKQDLVATLGMDRLLLPPHGRTVHQISSHNKKGKNGDHGWCLYRDDKGDAVIFDVAGPGCIRSIWATNIQPNTHLKIYFPDADKPRYQFDMIEFFKSKEALFPAPLNSFSRRGRYGNRPFAGNSFVPIPFAKGLRITLQGDLQFFHILYDKYPHGTGISDFSGKEDRSYLHRVFTRKNTPPYPLGKVFEHTRESKQISPGRSMIILDKQGGGCLRQLEIEGDSSQEFLVQTMLSINWDGQPLDAVRAPLGFFFGVAGHGSNLQTLPLTVEHLKGGRTRFTCWFPMPFSKSARITLHNRGKAATGPCRATCKIAKLPRPARDYCYFSTLYREGLTTYGRDWLLAENPGSGWFVGAVQSMQFEHYCEGDEHIYLDGAISPQIHGTGSEDYYLACFWPNLEFNSPFANCIGDVQELGGGNFLDSYRIPSCYSRFHLEAPIPFYAALDARIQHGGHNNIRSNYKSLSYCYRRNRPALTQTDFIDVANQASETDHSYRSDSASLTGPVTAYPEGNYLHTAVRESGRQHRGGEISFNVAIRPDNRGVRLRRRLDQASPRQRATVWIDGQVVGTWYHPDRNEHLRWFDSDFDIHPRYCRNKTSLKVKLVVQAEPGEGAYTDFRYWVYCFE